MRAELTLTGYAFSVYTRAVRMALAAKQVRYAYRECNPFEPQDSKSLILQHPFGRVPVLQHGAFRLWETQAILDYVEAGIDGDCLAPAGTEASARMRQVMGIVDAYLYWPMVRGIVSNALFVAPEERDDFAFQTGLHAAPPVLAALEEIASEGIVLRPDILTLADCLLWPMLDYVRQVQEGADLMAGCPYLTRWAEAMAVHPVAKDTAPNLTLYDRSTA